MSRSAARLAVPLLLVLARPALAQHMPGQVTGLPPASLVEPTLDEWVARLQGSDPDQRLLAARELARRAWSASHDLRHRTGGGLRWEEARIELAALDEQAVEPCVAALSDRRLAAPCARLLGRVGARRALPYLQDAPAELPRSARRAIRRAIERLQAP